MKEIIFAIILGIVQGLTEFLPISSSGHLMLLQEIFGITQNNLFLSVMLHLGTLLAVVIYYFKDLVGLLKPQNHKGIWLLFVATLPSAIAGLLLEDFISTKFKNIYLCFGFLFTALLLLLADYIYKKRQVKKELNSLCALTMGFGQCIALFPAISRSGTTISFGMIFGADKSKCANFSFLLSIPIILGSVVLEFFKINDFSVSIPSIMCGIIASFFAGLFSIKVMLKFVKGNNFKWFIIYLFALSATNFVNYFIYPIW
ncbi:MAG: undecaprenyl-diphosphate phosphatase [Christensenellales bacterium]